MKNYAHVTQEKHNTHEYVLQMWWISVELVYKLLYFTCVHRFSDLLCEYVPLVKWDFPHCDLTLVLTLDINVWIWVYFFFVLFCVIVIDDVTFMAQMHAENFSRKLPFYTRTF